MKRVRAMYDADRGDLAAWIVFSLDRSFLDNFLSKKRLKNRSCADWQFGREDMDQITLVKKLVVAH